MSFLTKIFGIRNNESEKNEKNNEEKVFESTGQWENKSVENIAPKQKCSPEREFGDPQKHNYRAINVEKHESGRCKIIYECADCGDTYAHFTPFIKEFTPDDYSNSAIDCYEAKKYALAAEFAQKAFDLKCNQPSMAAIMLIVSNIYENLEQTLDVCDKYYTLFHTYDEILEFIFYVKDILERAAQYMIENKKSEFAYPQIKIKNEPPNVIILPILRVINLLEKLNYLDSRCVYGFGNGFSQALIKNLIRQLKELMIELNNNRNNTYPNFQ